MIELIILRRAVNRIFPRIFPGSQVYEIGEADLWLRSLLLWMPAVAPQPEGHLWPVRAAESCLPHPAAAAAPLGQLQAVLPPSSSLAPEPEPAVRDQPQ